MKLIYVASPYAGDIEQNTAFARKACRHVMNEGHAFLRPSVISAARQVIPIAGASGEQDMGLAMLPRCDELWCCGDRISYGMHLEIEEAVRILSRFAG